MIQERPERSLTLVILAISPLCIAQRADSDALKTQAEPSHCFTENRKSVPLVPEKTAQGSVFSRWPARQVPRCLSFFTPSLWHSLSSLSHR